ncbi:MAG: AAA family ATPase, partial [Mycobacterium sp.]|nr:AAA family ATPase [Mycobacterium sp.]
AAAVAGDEELVLVVGPAGTGKTTALRPAVDQLRADGRAVFGVAPSANAAQVLTEETGVDADTIHKLLIEHHLPRPPDHRYALPPGATVIVDEAGMLPTDQLAQLVNLAAHNDWRLALVGDPQQFTAVGRGGMFELLVDTFGAIELDRVHRFDHTWERDASLRLRRGDIDIAETYDAHGRLHAGTPEQMMVAAVRQWWLARQSGDSALLMTQTNEAALQLSQLCQHLRVRAGELDANGRAVDLGDFYLLPGDKIVTRHNDRQLLTERGDMVRNRATWTIDVIHRDGSLTVHGDGGRVHLPVDYVAEHVELGYARTAMGGGQGRTVTAGLLYCDGPSDVRTLYTGMTRGTKTNQVFFGTTPDKTARNLFEQSLAIDWIDRPAHTRQAELAGPHPEHYRPSLAEDPTPAHPTPPVAAGPELSL